LGKRGESLAQQYLAEKGYRILCTNWRHEKDEVDIIAMDGEELVFVEVKTRSTNYYGEPEEDVGPGKESYLIRAAEAYLEKHGLNIDSRFDIIAIILNPSEKEIFHIEDAFYP
jgi:putative endonuclease